MSEIEAARAALAEYDAPRCDELLNPDDDEGWPFRCTEPRGHADAHACTPNRSVDAVHLRAVLKAYDTAKQRAEDGDSARLYLAAVLKETDGHDHNDMLFDTLSDAWQLVIRGICERERAAEQRAVEADAAIEAALKETGCLSVTVLVNELRWLRGMESEARRLRDLVRHQRGPLHDAELIDDAEYAALAGEHDAVARLEGYDAMRARLARAEKALAAERGEASGALNEGWTADDGGDGFVWTRAMEPPLVLDVYADVGIPTTWGWWLRRVNDDGEVAEGLDGGEAPTALEAMEAAEAALTREAP